MIKGKKLVALVAACVMMVSATSGVMAASSDSFSKYINDKHGYMIGAIAVSGGGTAKGVSTSTSVTGTGNNVYVTLEVQNNTTGATIYGPQTKSDASYAQVSTGLIFNGRIAAFSAHEIRANDGAWGAYLRAVED